MMIPVFGVLQAMVLLGEPLGEGTFPGALLVGGGIWLAQGGWLPTLTTTARRLRPAAQAA